jgi:hypothetical protein
VVLVLGALALQLVFAVVAMPGMVRLHGDLGGELPAITRLVASLPWRVGFTLWIVVGGGLAVLRSRRGGGGLLALVLGSCAVSWVMHVFAFYAPLFALAGNIKE